MMILIVEGRTPLAAAVQPYLRGHNMMITQTSAHAKESLARDMFDAVFVDDDFDDGRGHDLVRWLRSTGSTVRVVGVSAGDGAAMSAAGADATCSHHELARVADAIGAALTVTPKVGDTTIETLYDLLDVVRVRPGMWIGELSITRLTAFIYGFLTGIDAAGRRMKDEQPPFRDLHAWVASRLGRPLDGFGWTEMLLEACGSEEAAFERFWIELDAFRAAAG